MAHQKKSIAVSFRLPIEAVKELKKTIQHTKWIQMIVLKNMGKCPVCGTDQDLKKQEKNHE